MNKVTTDDMMSDGQRCQDALQQLVSYLESDPSLYDGDDDGALGRLMEQAHSVLNTERAGGAS